MSDAPRNHHSHAELPRLPVTAPAADRLLALEDRIFTWRRIRLYGFSLAATLALLLAWEIVYNGRSVIDPAGRPVCIDFCTIWVSGKFAVSSDPARVYDYSVFSAAQPVLVGPRRDDWPDYHFPYPPTFLLFTYPLGFMSYLTAFVVWTIATLLLYLIAVYMILPRPAALLAAVTPVFVGQNILLGQNGFLTAGLIGLSLVLLERRPSLSGIFLGLLTFKPHFGVLFPFMLLASREWRAIGSATVTGVTLTVISALAFGYQGWLAFFAALGDRTSSLSPDEGFVQGFHSVFGFLYAVGAGAWVSWIAHLSVAGIIALIICVVWAKPIPRSLQAAIICTGSVIVTPYVLVYDLCILSMAVAFLVNDGLIRGFLPSERTTLLICFVGSFFLPLVPTFVIFFLITRRIVSYRRQSTDERTDDRSSRCSIRPSWSLWP